MNENNLYKQERSGIAEVFSLTRQCLEKTAKKFYKSDNVIFSYTFYIQK